MEMLENEQIPGPRILHQGWKNEPALDTGCFHGFNYSWFWLKPWDFVKENQLNEALNSQSEGLTGPVALRSCLRQWEKDREERKGSDISAHGYYSSWAHSWVFETEDE